LPAELTERTEYFEEHFLGQVQRFLVVTEQVQRQLVDHSLVVRHQPRTGLFFRGDTPLDQRPIGARCV
jgi:hypothetical protein